MKWCSPLASLPVLLVLTATATSAPAPAPAAKPAPTPAPAPAPAATPDPADHDTAEGCFTLGMSFPKDLAVTDDMASSALVSAKGKEICLVSKGVKGGPSDVKSGDFTITVTDAGKVVVSYVMKASIEDGSGHHYDFVYAAKPATLKKLKPEAYTRGGHAPYPNVIFYVVLMNQDDLKAGDYAGSVSLGNLRYQMFKK